MTPSTRTVLARRFALRDAVRLHAQRRPDRTFSITTSVPWTIAIDQRESESDRCGRAPR